MKDTHLRLMPEEQPNTTTPTTTHQNPRKSSHRCRVSLLSTEPNKTFTQQDINSGELLQTKSPRLHPRSEADGIMINGSAPAPTEMMIGVNKAEALVEGSGRERLKRHRSEVAGRVLIPDNWSQEELLTDWIDYSSFDALLVPSGIASAREALAAEGRGASAGGLRIESRC
ncbi:hypothetical protein L1049_013005 [Liquidambar formosana]|uniref:Protein BIC1 n=1 Tax=Liquidambar formosana TaxID=63359 RepID=A0AAP0WWL7_LIQFO